MMVGLQRPQLTWLCPRLCPASPWSRQHCDCWAGVKMLAQDTMVTYEGANSFVAATLAVKFVPALLFESASPPRKLLGRGVTPSFIMLIHSPSR